jgi:hypothetical protein
MTLASCWPRLQSRNAAEEVVNMNRELKESPVAAGRRWAEARVESLEGLIPAVDWPEVWPSAWDEPLDLPEEVGDADAPAYRVAAHHAAAERWIELLDEREVSEALREEEADEEAAAVRLLTLLEADLPRGLTAWRDGPLVVLRDAWGNEATVRSLRDAWRAVSEFDERLTG